MQIMNTEKPADRLARSYRCRKHRANMSTLVLISVVIVVQALCCQPAIAATEPEYLYITGIIKSVNYDTGLVMVDVLSSSCRGMRMFKAEKMNALEAHVDQKRSFFINTERCKVKEVYSIIVNRGIWK